MDIKSVVENQRKFFNSHKTMDLKFRLDALRRLRKGIQENEKEIIKAIYDDFRKPEFETYETEIGVVLDEIRHAEKNLSKWIKPKKVRTPITNFKSKSVIYPEPYGVVLIVSPWNYPFQLTIAPLIGAICAGNCSIIKTASYTTNTSKVISKLIGENFNQEYIKVIEGGREVNEAVFREKFDYIFFTGSPNVGRIVMKAAAENLTPVTLELGGKSPCIVHEDADLEIAARRIVWGKFINCGQTCIAPDYVMVHRNVKTKLLSNIERYIKQFYGNDPSKSKDFARIINLKHFNRLCGLIDDKKVVVGGVKKENELYISPTVMDNVKWDDAVMQEEIFGPILPVMTYESIDDIVYTLNEKHKPLALYLFTNNEKHKKRIIKETSYGGGCINDTIMHIVNSNMPFGGVGNSGIGGYHGISSFKTFSHMKSVLEKSTKIDIQLRYPPYDGKLKLIKKILK